MVKSRFTFFAVGLWLRFSVQHFHLDCLLCCFGEEKKMPDISKVRTIFFKKLTSSPPPLPPDDDDVYAASLKCQMICANNQKLDLRPLKLKVFVFQVHDESCGATRDIALSVTNEN